ncbi:unnamed protein product [Schistosoma spindalis]|nr:unnamed protein product [Schistosoma spindale]
MLYGTELRIRPRQNSKFQDLKIRSVPPSAYQFFRPRIDPSYSAPLHRSHFNESTDYIHHTNHRRDPFLNLTPPARNRHLVHEMRYNYYSRYEHNLHPLPSYNLPPYGWQHGPPVSLENRPSERRWSNEYSRHMSSTPTASRRERSPYFRHNSSRPESSYNRHKIYLQDISDKDLIHPGIENIKHILVVTSGKGGVGKSTVAAQVAINLWNSGFCAGILDIDFCGPSIPRILGLENNKIHSCAEGWLPVYADGHTKRFPVVSIGFLLDNPDSAVIWRGPRKGSMVGEFLNSVCWGKLDYLVIDTPPGTSDEHITVLEHLQKSTSDVDVGIIIVSTPQRVSLCDVSRELGFCMKTNIKVIGLVENMSGYKCPNCTQCTNVFSYGGAEALAVEKNVRFLGRLPFDPTLTVACDRAGDFQSKIYTSEDTKLLTEKILSVLSV